MTAAKLATIEAGRRALGLSIETLAAAAEISERHYRRITHGHPAPADMLARLSYALRRKAQPLANGEAVGFAYDAALALVCAKLSLDPAAVRSFDPQRGATADRAWREASHARQAAIWLVNTAGGVKQRAIAEALALTPAAICLGLKSVEDRRGDNDDSAVAHMLDELAAAIGGEAP